MWTNGFEFGGNRIQRVIATFGVVVKQCECFYISCLRDTHGFLPGGMAPTSLLFKVLIIKGAVIYQQMGVFNECD